MAAIELNFEMGVGNEAVPDPAVRIATSSNGKTFTDERILPLGKVGEYQRRAIRRRMGRFGHMVLFKIILSDAVKPVFIRLDADLEIGAY